MKSGPVSSKPLADKLHHIWFTMVKPSSTIQKADEQRKVRLLSTFIILLFLLFLAVNLSYYFLFPNYVTSRTDLIGYYFSLQHM